MPDVRVQDEQGTVHVFPDGSTPEMIAKAMNVKLPSAELQPPDAIAQSRAQMASRVHPTTFISPGKDAAPITSPFSEQKINQALPQVPGMVKNIRKGALQAGGAAFGGEFGSLAKGLPWFIRMMAGASGAGVGAGAGTLAGGGSPQEALSTAAGTTMASAPLSGIAEAVANPETQNYLASKLRYPATARQSQMPGGRPGTVKGILPSFLQKYTIPEGLIPKGEVGTPTNPGPFMEIPAKAPKGAIHPYSQPAAPPPELGSAENPGWMSSIPKRMPKPVETPLPTPELGTAENPAWHSKIPTRMPKPLPIPESQPVSPFAGMTPSQGLSQGNATPFPGIAQSAESSTAPVRPTFLQKFEPQGKSRIVEPGSEPPDVKVTYQSVPQKDLLGKVMSGDRLAITEWQRRGLPLPENVGYMTESAGTMPWRNYRK